VSTVTAASAFAPAAVEVAVVATAAEAVVEVVVAVGPVAAGVVVAPCTSLHNLQTPFIDDVNTYNPPPPLPLPLPLPPPPPLPLLLPLLLPLPLLSPPETCQMEMVLKGWAVHPHALVVKDGTLVGRPVE
jgi:hypothetical protein